MNNRFLQALGAQNSGRPPVWLMRQAGRYMPEYQALRKGRSFLDMCRTPEIAVEVTKLPLRLLDVDAAILFADILLVADALGAALRFEEGKGPIFERPIRNVNDVNALPDVQAAEALGYVGEAVGLLRQEIDVPLIGFAGAPFTVASYMVEGGSSRELKTTRQWMRREPEAFEMLLEKVSDLTIDYLRMQVDAGAQALQLFDTWACYLDYAQFTRYSLHYMQRVLDGLRECQVPVILFCKGASVWADELAATGAQGLSLDWQCSLPKLRRQLPAPLVLQGNLDPYLLYAPHDVIRAQTERLLQEMAGDPAFVVNLGHGILPDMSVDAVRVLVDTVKGASYAHNL